MTDQAENLRRKLAGSQQQNIAKTICFISGKGGVGKSNIALNFAIKLQQARNKVLLIDFDIGMGNIDVLLGISSKNTLADLFEKGLPIKEIINSGPKNLDFISGGSGLTNIFTLNNEKKDYFYNQYNNLVRDYDYIIFDMGAGVTDDSMYFILAADECIVVITPEPTSITDGYGMIKHVVKNQPNMPIYVVMNRCQSKTTGRKAVQKFEQVIWQFLKKKIKIIGILPNDQLVPISVMRQMPFVLLNNRAPIKVAMVEMVKKYLSDKNNIQNQDETLSFIQKLKALIRKR